MFKKECNEIHEENIKVVVSGRRDNLRPDVLEAIDYIVEKTKDNTKGIFNVCLNYGGQQEIVDGAKRLAEDYKNGLISLDDIDENQFFDDFFED